MSRYGLSLSGSEVLPCGKSPWPSLCSWPASSTSYWNFTWPVRLPAPGLARRFISGRARSLRVARCQLTIPVSSVHRRTATPPQDLSILQDQMRSARPHPEKLAFAGRPICFRSPSPRNNELPLRDGSKLRLLLLPAWLAAPYSVPHPVRVQVRTQEPQGWYFNVGSTGASAPVS